MKENGTCFLCERSTYSQPIVTLTGRWETLDATETTWSESFSGNYEGEYVTAEGEVKGYKLSVIFTPMKLHHAFICNDCVAKEQNKIKAEYDRFPWENVFLLMGGSLVVIVLCGFSIVCPPVILLIIKVVNDWRKEYFGPKDNKFYEEQLKPENIRNFLFKNQSKGQKYANSMSDSYYRKITGYKGIEDITQYKPAYFSIISKDNEFSPSWDVCK